MCEQFSVSKFYSVLLTSILFCLYSSAVALGSIKGTREVCVCVFVLGGLTWETNSDLSERNE